MRFPPVGPRAHAADGKRFCVGIELDPWHIPYDGRCRFGSSLGPMQTTLGLLALNMEALRQELRDRGVPDGDRARLLDEIPHFQTLTAGQGQRRLKREARRGRKSAAARDAVNCAVFGSLAAGVKLLEDLAFDQQVPSAKDLAKRAVEGCALAVGTPRLLRWIKAKGYAIKD